MGARRSLYEGPPPSLSGDAGRSEAYAKSMGVGTLPATLIISRSGNVVEFLEGPAHWNDRELEERVLRLAATVR